MIKKRVVRDPSKQLQVVGRSVAASRVLPVKLLLEHRSQQFYIQSSCSTIAPRSKLREHSFDQFGVSLSKSTQQSRAMALSSNSAIRPDVKQLFDEFYENFPKECRDDVWYLTLASSLTALGAPSLVGSLFSYVAAKKGHSSSTGDASSHAALIALSSRFHSTFFKIFTLVGIAPVINAFFALVSAETALGIQTPPTSTTPSPIPPLDAANYTRGEQFLDMLYQHDLPAIVARMGRHGPDIMEMEYRIIYGLYLADFEILDAKETEFVAMPALLCGGAKGAPEWHIRGCKRVGWEWSEIAQVVAAVAKAADWVLGPEDLSIVNHRVEVAVGLGRTAWLSRVEKVRQEMSDGESSLKQKP